MSDDGLSASASSVESMVGAALDAPTVAKPRRSARPKNGHAVNGQGVGKKQKLANRSMAGLEADNVVPLHRDPDKVPLGVRGLFLDMAAYRLAREWLRHPVDKPPDLVFFWREEKAQDGSPSLRPAQAFSGYGGCPIALFVLRQPGDVLGTNQDEYRIAWGGEGFWHNRPQRVPAKALCEIDLPRKMFATAVLPSERALVAKIIAIQTRDTKESIIIRLPPPGLVCEADSWSYAFPYSDNNRGDSSNPARRLYTEIEGGQVVIRNAMGGEPIPIRPISLSRLALLADYLSAWDPDGRALVAFSYGARSQCASLAPPRATFCGVGTPETGKTTTLHYVMRCASRMGSPEFRLSGEGGTAASLDHLARNHRDCLIVMDDGDGSPEGTRACVRGISTMHGGGQLRRRMNRNISAADGAYLECGLAITMESLDGVNKGRQRRMILILFDKSSASAADFPDFARQLLGEALPADDFESCFDAGVPAGREAMESVISYILHRLQRTTDKAIDAGAIFEQAEQQAKQQFAEQIEQRNRRTIGQLLVILHRRCPGQRFLKSVAEAFAVTWGGAVLLDRAAGFVGPLELDTPIDVLGPMTSRLRRFIIDHAVRAIGILNGHVAVDANAIAEQFPRDLQRLLTSGRWGLHGFDGGMPKLKGVPPESIGWIRDPDAEKALQRDRRPPPKPGLELEQGWRGPLRVLGYCKGNEIWIELNLFSPALSDSGSEIDYEQRDMVLPRLRDAGIIVPGGTKHLTASRRIKGKLRRFIIVRADKIWPPEAKAPTRDAADDHGAHIITLPVAAAARPADGPIEPRADNSSPPAATSVQPAPAPVKPLTPAVNRSARVAAAPREVAQDQAIAVVGDDGGYRIDRAGGISPIDAPRPGASPSDLLDWCRLGQVEQLNLEASWCAAAGLPVEWQDKDGLVRRYLTHEGLPHPWVSVPEGGRWRISHPGELHWSIWAHPNGGSSRNSIEIVLPGYDDRAALHKAPDVATLTCALAEFRTAMTFDDGRAGFAYRRGPGETFISTWQSLARDKGAADVAPDRAPVDFPPPARPLEGSPVRHVAGNIYWTRRPIAEEASAAFAIVFDKNGMFPGAISGMRCGIGGLQRLQAPITFDKNSPPGWWLVRYKAPGWSPCLPAPGGLLAPGLTGWLETATVAFLYEIEAKVDILDAWVWSYSTRALDRLQHVVRDARTRLMARSDDTALPDVVKNGASIALDTLKSCIVRGIAWFDRRDDRSKTEIVPRYRPHWKDGTMARATANFSRDANRAGERSGLYPVGVYVDALVYLSDQPDAAALAARLGLPLGTSFGQYKVVSVIPAEKVMPVLHQQPDGAAPILTPAQRKARREFFAAIDEGKRADAEGQDE